MIVKVIGSGVDDTPAPTNPKRYTALLTQTGTNNPTQVILENTTGKTFTWTYSLLGAYVCNSATLPANKYTMLLGSNFKNTNNSAFLVIASDNLFAIRTVITSNSGGASVISNDILVNTMFEVLIYD